MQTNAVQIVEPAVHGGENTVQTIQTLGVEYGMKVLVALLVLFIGLWVNEVAMVLCCCVILSNFRLHQLSRLCQQFCLIGIGLYLAQALLKLGRRKCFYHINYKYYGKRKYWGNYREYIPYY